MSYQIALFGYQTSGTTRLHRSALIIGRVLVVPACAIPMTLPIFVTLSGTANAHRSKSKQSSGEK